jgi:hypothetical protein
MRRSYKNGIPNKELIGYYLRFIENNSIGYFTDSTDLIMVHGDTPKTHDYIPIIDPDSNDRHEDSLDLYDIAYFQYRNRYLSKVSNVNSDDHSVKYKDIFTGNEVILYGSDNGCYQRLMMVNKLSKTELILNDIWTNLHKEELMSINIDHSRIITDRNKVTNDKTYYIGKDIRSLREAISRDICRCKIEESEKFTDMLFYEKIEPKIEYVPFTFEDYKDLIGKLIKRVNVEKECFMITSLDEYYVYFRDDQKVPYFNLTVHYEFCDTKKPVGKVKE